MQASELLTEAIRYCHQGGDADAVDALLRVKTDLLARIRADYPRALVGERLYAVAEVLHIPVSDEVTPR